MEKHYDEMYRCGNCSKLHEDEYDAEQCCAPDVDEVYVCKGCKKEFDIEKEAMAHKCASSEPPRCLCGSDLAYGDAEASALIGSITYCTPCRELILQGVPAPVARDRNFWERLAS